MKRESATLQPKLLELSSASKAIRRNLNLFETPGPGNAQASEMDHKLAAKLYAIADRVISHAWRALPAEVRVELSVLEKEGLLSPDTFRKIALTTATSMLIEQQAENKATALGIIRTWKRQLKDIADRTHCMALSRALSQGLVRELATRDTFETEVHAWELAAMLEFGDVFNSTQTLPGYQDAAKSVHEVMGRRKKTRNEDAYSKGIWGRKLATAMASYWLPLGLWAMSIEDALESLRIFGVANRISDLMALPVSDAREETLADLRASDLPAIKPKDRRWRGRFSSAVSDLNLYCADQPMIHLEYRGSAGERLNPEKWNIVFRPGFDCSGKW